MLTTITLTPVSTLKNVTLRLTAVQKRELDKQFGAEAVNDRLIHDRPLNPQMLDKQLTYEKKTYPPISSVDVSALPEGWQLDDKITQTATHGRKIRTRLTGPDGASGKVTFAFKNGILALEKEYRSSLPSKIPNTGTFNATASTIAYLSARAIKLLGVTNRNLHAFKVSRLQHPLTIAHLNWLQRNFPDKPLGELLMMTSWGKRMQQVVGTVGHTFKSLPVLSFQNSPDWARAHPGASQRDWAYALQENERMTIHHITQEPIARVNDPSRDWRSECEKAIKTMLAKITDPGKRATMSQQIQAKRAALRKDGEYLEARYQMNPAKDAPIINFDMLFKTTPNSTNPR